jgi:hypothetical protein
MSAVVVPSFSAKVNRAKKHLVDLEVEINRYGACKPYAVSTRIEGKKKEKIHRLDIKSSPANTDIPIIAADAIYNLQSSLEHLMASLVPKNMRNKVTFPIYFQGVWESPLPGENKERTRERKQWASDTSVIHHQAVTFLKSLQPPDNGGNVDEFNLLAIIKGLSNRDRHEKLPVIASGLRGMAVEWRRSDGNIERGLLPNTDVNAFFGDKTKIPLPNGAMDVKVEGAPVIEIRIPKAQRSVQPFMEIPDRLSMMARLIEKQIIPTLAPYSRSDYP